MDEKKRRIARKLAWGFAAATGTVLLASGGAFAYFHYTYANTIGPHVEVAGRSVSGLTQAAAKEVVQNAIDPVAATPVTLQGDGIQESIAPEKLGVVYDVDATVASAYSVGRESNPILTVLDQIQLLIGRPISKPAIVTFERKPVDDTLDTINSKMGDAAVDAGLKLASGKLQTVDEHAGNSIDAESVVANVLDRLRSIGTNRSIQVAMTRREPTVHAADVTALIPTLQPLASMPLTLTVTGGNPIKVDAATLVSWIGFVRTTDLTSTKWVLATIPVTDGTAASVQAVVDQKALKSYVEGVAKKVDQAPVDAKLSIQNGKATVFQASQTGRGVDQDAAVSAIADALTVKMKPVTTSVSTATTKLDALTVALPVTTVQPAVANETIASLGINQLIGTGSTDFSGSPSNRVHNITVGTQYLTGHLIKPGEEFSTVGALGVIDGTTGYLPELVIKNNKTISEFGGGLCQVSTTLFRSVMNAGLPITEREAHAYRVVYYERSVGPGLDATIYDPKPDFKFRNDTPGWILVQGSITGNTLKFELYGTSDGRTSTIDGPHLLETYAPPAEIDTVDASLAPGTKKQTATAHPGGKTVATYTVTRDGKVINQQTFSSTYRAMPAEFTVGPAVDTTTQSSDTTTTQSTDQTTN